MATNHCRDYNFGIGSVVLGLICGHAIGLSSRKPTDEKKKRERKKKKGAVVKLRYPQGGVARYNVQSLESSEVLNASKVEIGVIFASLSTRLNVGGVLLSPTSMYVQCNPYHLPNLFYCHFTIAHIYP